METQKISASLEDYLEAIYEIIEEKQGVKAIEISRRLGVARSSVTEALKILADKRLINYGRYDVISMTSQGEKTAREIILKHNVLFEFFSRILGINPDEAHENACRVEHVISEDVLKRLISFVKFNNKFHSDNRNYLDEFQKFYEEMNKE